jgi:hypothetical protein
MTQLPEALRELMQEQILGAQNDGMRLGIKFGAKTLRDIADGLDKEPGIAPDYIRGMRDAAVFIERFAEDVNTQPPNEA